MSPPRIRRLFSVSIRTMLLVTVVLCVLLAAGTRQARRQKEAVEWVEQMGGRVGYNQDHIVDGFGGLYLTTGNFDQDGNMVPTPPPGPAWCRDLIGLDYFATVIIVDLDGINTSTLSHLAALTDLQALHLNKTEVTDLSPLSGLGHLQVLSLNHTLVSDLAPIRKVGHLRHLSLAGTPVRDLTPLVALSGLAELNLAGTPVSDFAALERLPSLTTLWLNDTIITEREVADLRRVLPQCHIYCDW